MCQASPPSDFGGERTCVINEFIIDATNRLTVLRMKETAHLAAIPELI